MTTAQSWWYGFHPAWQVALEAQARREHGDVLRLHLNPGLVTYIVPIDVPGRRRPVPAAIEFHRRPYYDCYGLASEDYPRVHAAPGETSPHRMPDDALCLYYPASPADERWRAADGLLALIDLIRNHLFFEDYWRATGGHRRGIWLGAEAPHGFARARVA
ncbi:hypothetical protein [Actinokineospora diospyrosa]|uniref:Uncharacterized protein n=1 Tax=Actinokineospora diospyrosa TaxID=103728 RepID=A0ABT1IE08_9PSEU|nr:hypothetical protein [Actinokineospora diospyrosa]MCP2270870.1 hypothetical protein [Actinokineospora diospyrosa]